MATPVTGHTSVDIKFEKMLNEVNSITSDDCKNLSLPLLARLALTFASKLALFEYHKYVKITQTIGGHIGGSKVKHKKSKK